MCDLVATDSCPSENKCVSVFTFYSSLLMSGTIQLVQFCYPLPGHSHNSVDALFGAISGRMRRVKNVTTLSGLLKVCYFNMKFMKLKKILESKNCEPHFSLQKC